VLVFKERPAGKAGLTDQEVAVPTTCGVIELMAVPEVKLYTMDPKTICGAGGGGGFTRIVIVVVPLPPAFVAVTVYTALGESEVGLPDISPVVVSIDKPAGKVGAIDQETTGFCTLGVKLVIGTSVVNVFTELV
jgi:hypothetical protein